MPHYCCERLVRAPWVVAPLRDPGGSGQGSGAFLKGSLLCRCVVECCPKTVASQDLCTMQVAWVARSSAERGVGRRDGGGGGGGRAGGGGGPDGHRWAVCAVAGPAGRYPNGH